MAAKGLLLRLKRLVRSSKRSGKECSNNHLESSGYGDWKEYTRVCRFGLCVAGDIIRLCRKLGCAGYRDFQHALVYENALFKDSREISVQEIIPTPSTEDNYSKGYTKKHRVS